MSVGGFVYLLALVAFAIAGALLAGRGELCISRELAVLGRRPSAAIRLRHRCS